MSAKDVSSVRGGFPHAVVALAGVAFLGVAALSASAQTPLVIDHRSVAAVAGFSAATMTQAGQLRFFFAHASVGGNILTGLGTLHTEDPARYPFVRVYEDATPPDATAGGGIYEYGRGNPGWQVKIDTFADYVTNGWRAPKIHVAINKFCYVDPKTDLDYYRSSMTALEAECPEVVFVYVTIPLTTKEDADNYRRNVFNAALRTWVRDQGRVLYDLADIEAHDPGGVESTFVYETVVCQKLFSGYTTDGGHLVASGQRLAALGWYALAVGLFQTDRDGDGASDGAELISGSAPAEAQSAPLLQSQWNAAERQLTLAWRSATDRTYALQRTADLCLGEAGFVDLAAGIAATPPANSFVDSPPEGGAWFYRLVTRH